MKIWIDADAAPREMKEIVFKAAHRLSIEVLLVANQSIAVPANVPTARAIAVAHGANVADEYIASHSESGDLVITADIPLAKQLVDNGIAVIDPRGEEFHADNIASRASMRDFLDAMRGAGETIAGAKPYGQNDKRAFAQAFDRTLTRLIRQARSKPS